MITTTTHFQRRRPIVRMVAIRLVRLRLLGLLALLGFACVANVLAAESVLNDISYTALPGGKVEVTLKFEGTMVEPQAFTTDTPPRIALDFSNTRNSFTQRHVDIGTGATSGVSVVEAAGRTRVVVNLFRSTSYDTRIEDDKLILTINNGLMGASAVAASAAVADPTKAVAVQNVEISNVDFRRGKNGEGRIVITFSGPGASADLKREGDKIVLDMFNVKLPPNQAQRLDVLDFATPVQFIESHARGNGARMEIAATAPFEQLAYQTGSEYVVEVSPKREEEKVNTRNGEIEYSGSRVTFNFQDIPVRSVLQLIADVSDLNIVVADSVSGNVTLRLINVPWDQAMDIILRARGLDKRRQGNVVWVAPQREIAEREQSMADAHIKLDEKVELMSDYIPVSYGKASDIAALLSRGAGKEGEAQRGLLSPRGSVTFDSRTNILLVSDTPQKIQEIRQLVAVLDRPVQQVLIESRIVIATNDFARDLGVKFGVSGGYEDKNGNVITTTGSQTGADKMTNLALANRFAHTGSAFPVIAPGGAGSGIGTPSLADRLNVNLPSSNNVGHLGLSILGANTLIDLELSAGQSEGRSEVVSSPRVVTANQQKATIKQGREVGYVTSSSSGGATTSTVNFKEVVLQLEVTPTITADDRVFLNLNVKKDDVAQFINSPGGGQVPDLDKREISTAVLVDNGQTVVLGGVHEEDKSNNVTKVPVLGDVPIVGNLFRTTSRKNSKAELLIFVTPRILNESLK